MNTWLLGAGGTGGWLSQLYVRNMKPEDSLLIWDADKVEEKNLERQFYVPSDIGKSKATALMLKLRTENPGKPNIEARDEFFTADVEGRPDALLCAVDNHVGRKASLEFSDNRGSLVILCGNGYESAEAYAYLPAWSGTARDPRVYFPEILTDLEGDPLSPPCTGIVAQSTPQLALANALGAAYSMLLFRFYTVEAQSVEDRNAWPIRIMNNFARVQTHNYGDFTTAEVKNRERNVT